MMVPVSGGRRQLTNLDIAALQDIDMMIRDRKKEEDLGFSTEGIETLEQARKKLAKLRRATELFVEIQPEVSTHTNFQMAAASLQAAVTQIEDLLRQS